MLVLNFILVSLHLVGVLQQSDFDSSNVVPVSVPSYHLEGKGYTCSSKEAGADLLQFSRQTDCRTRKMEQNKEIGIVMSRLFLTFGIIIIDINYYLVLK